MSEEEIIEALDRVSKMDNMSKDTTEITFGIYYIKAIRSLLDLYNKEKEKNKELEYSLKNNVVTKYCIRHKADDYESKGYIEIAGAMRELLEERN